jgi:hypothetical protein
VRALSIHARYRCGNTGVCCSSGWDIPVERGAEDGLRRALSEGRLAGSDALVPAAVLPRGARVVLGRDRRGRCVFLEPGVRGRCAVHARLGEEALPSACRQFPRIATLSPLGVSVSLSHYCPTAAALLFGPEDAGPLRIVESPAAFPASWPFEGLDARGALPPLLRPGVLASWPALERWEHHAVAILADASLGPERAVAHLAASAERLRGWTSERGAFEVFVDETLGVSSDAPGVGAASRVPRTAIAPPAEAPTLDPLTSWELVASTVPAAHPRPAPPVLDGSPGALTSRGGADREDEHAPVRRWLAARAFGSWLALQGPGFRTNALFLAVALAVLRAEQARFGPDGRRDGQDGRRDDRLLEAIRRADLLLVHLADPQALATRLGACERTDASRVLASLRRA